MPSRHRKTQRNFKCTLLSKEANLKRFHTAWFQLYNKSKTVETAKRFLMGCGTTQMKGRRDEWMEYRECARERRSHPTLHNTVMVAHGIVLVKTPIRFILHLILMYQASHGGSCLQVQYLGS